MRLPIPLVLYDVSLRYLHILLTLWTLLTAQAARSQLNDDSPHLHSSA